MANMDLKALDRKLTLAARTGFELALVFFVWNCGYWLTVFLRDPCFRGAQEAICSSTDTAMLMKAFLAFWSFPLAILAYDLFQMRRGKLPPVLRWVRSVPAGLIVILLPALLLFFRWTA